MQIPQLNYVTLLAITAGVGACWRQCLGLFQRARSLVIIRVTVENQLIQNVVGYCWRNLRRSPWGGGDRRYSSYGAFVRPEDRQIQVAFEKMPTQPILFWKGWRPLFLSCASQTEFHNGGANDSRLTVTFLRGSFQPDEFIQAATDHANEIAHPKNVQTQGNRRFAVHRIVGRDRNVIRQANDSSGQGLPGHPVSEKTEDGHVITDRVLRWKGEEIGPRDPEDPLGPYAFPPEVEDLIGEATRWKDSEAWFKSKRIPWRRGYLLHGRPGGGKSSLIRALGQLLDLPIYVYDLATLSNEELVSHWKAMLANTPAIAAMEDLDACFHGRENVSGTKGGLTFDCLLNVLSGIEEGDGVFTVVTTNHIDRIDPALGNPGTDGAISTRPGRLDRTVELKGMTEACRRKVAARILEDCAWLVDETVAAGAEDSGAQFTERCGQLALREYWQDQELTPVQMIGAFGGPTKTIHRNGGLPARDGEISLGDPQLPLPAQGAVIYGNSLSFENSSRDWSQGDLYARPPQPDRTHGN